MVSKQLQNFLNIKITNKNVNEIKKYIPTIIADTFLSHDLVSKNKQLKKYANEISGQNYKDYLFTSRTILYARLVKDIYINQHDNETLFFNKFQNVIVQMVIENSKFTNDLSNIDDNSKKKTTYNSSEKKSESPLTKWQSIINRME